MIAKIEKVDGPQSDKPGDLLARKILGCLEERPGQLARDIAEELGHEWTEINSCLFGLLGNKVTQDLQYRWSISGSSSDSPSSKSIPSSKTDLESLCRYYLDSISSYDGSETSLPAKSSDGPSYVELPEDAITSSSGLNNAMASDASKQLLADIRFDQKSLGLTLGFPCCIRKSDRNGMIVEPLFLFPVSPKVPKDGQYAVDLDGFCLNFHLHGQLSHSGGQTALSSGLALMAELGTEDGPPPDWNDFFDRLHRLKREGEGWKWIEEPNLSQLDDTPPLEEATQVGLYNRAILFGREKSPYTVGLEHELTYLKSRPPANYSNTALGSWIAGKIGETPMLEDELLKVLPLNAEQQEAVRSGLAGPLSVITGPPGTGKSQVVTSLLLNAAWKGKKVLFASKNNKAVDVVESRINSLGSRPMLLRLGTSEMRVELANHLSLLMGAKTDASAKTHYETSLRKYKGLQTEIKKLEKEADDLIALRNRVDEFERNVEHAREDLGPGRFNACRKIDPEEFDKGITDLTRSVDCADRSSQPFVSRIFWRIMRKKRWDALVEEAGKSHAILDILDLQTPSPPDKANDSVETWRYLLGQMKHISNANGPISAYQIELDRLGQARDLSTIDSQLLKLANNGHRECLGLWKSWLSIQPSKLTQSDKKALGDFVSTLKLMAAGAQSGRDYKKYYGLFPNVANSLPCWAVTSLSARGRIPLESGFFDLVVIDEASQCDIASALPLLYRAKAAVIIGDSQQLRHISSLAPIKDKALLSKHGLTENHMGWAYSVSSLFDLATQLCSVNQITILRDHHRSHQDIIEFSNQEFYEGKLRLATRQASLRPVGTTEYGIRWLDTIGEAISGANGGLTNRAEAKAVVEELRRMVIEKKYDGSIGVVSPFRAQVSLIQRLVNGDQSLSNALDGREFIVGTAHGLQGDERDVIIFSPGVSQNMPAGPKGFLKSTPNIFNVAITRARCCLVVVGSLSEVATSGIKHLEAFARYYKGLGSNPENMPADPRNDLGATYPNVAKPELVSDWERLFYKHLYAAGIRAIPQFNVESYILDFALFDGSRQLNIEVDGEQYHRNWDGDLVLRDRIRNHRLMDLGWDVQRFWVYQIRDEMDDCINKVKAWLENDSSAKQNSTLKKANTHK